MNNKNDTYCAPASDFGQLPFELKKLRLLNGLTQKDIAKELKTTTTYISNIETGKTKINLHTLIAYANVCNFSIDSLLGLNIPSKRSIDSDTLDNILFTKIKDLPIDDKKKIIQIIDVIK